LNLRISHLTFNCHWRKYWNKSS